MKTKYIIMRKISKSFEIILFLLFVFVPCYVFADDFEDDFIDAQLYEQANETDNKSNEDFGGVTPEPVLDNQDLTSEPTKEEDHSGDQDPEPLRNSSQDPEPDVTNIPDTEPEKTDTISPGTSKGSKENDEASAEPLDYSEDLDVIINLLQNVQLTMMIVCGIIIGFFFITRLLP